MAITENLHESALRRGFTVAKSRLKTEGDSFFFSQSPGYLERCR